MITIIVLIMMLPAFYIGSRTVNILLVDQSHIDAVLQTATTTNPQQIQIDKNFYIIGVIIMAVVTGSYTIAGGLKAVIVTDVIQSILMLLAAIIVAFLTFSQPEIGGWANLRAMDAAGKDMFHLHLPSDHPQRALVGYGYRAYGAALLLLGCQSVYCSTCTCGQDGQGGQNGYHYSWVLQAVDPIYLHWYGYSCFLLLLPKDAWRRC